MENYQNRGGTSGVAAYEVGKDFIRVMFKDGAIYLYNNAVTGSQHINQMKLLSANGQGLNSYIIKNVRKKYAKKER